MNTKSIVAIATTLVGCGLNNIFLEYMIRYDAGCGHLITFGQFLFIAVHGLIFTSEFGAVKPKIPLSSYFLLVTLLFATSIVNNWAFNFNIPVPLHMIFRAGSLISNMIMGILILKKKYTLEKYLSVAMITAGIVICTLYSSKKGACTDCNDAAGGAVKTGAAAAAEQDEYFFFWWVIGIVLLTGALLLSAGMGIYQETVYAKYGKHPKEALFYTHFYSLPGFLLYASSIWEHMQIASNSEPYEVAILGVGTGVTLPIIWLLLLLNVITQYFCISSVYVLTTECTSLTVTLVLTLRKFMSLIFSIIYFQNPFTSAHWFGTALVFLGTLIFTETHKALLQRKRQGEETKKTK